METWKNKKDESIFLEKLNEFLDWSRIIPVWTWVSAFFFLSFSTLWCPWFIRTQNFHFL
jgi:hypothetical protein